MTRSTSRPSTTRARRLVLAAAAVPLLVAVPASAGQLVGTAGLKNGAVTTPKIKNGAVTAAKLQNGAVVGPKLASSAVSTAKLQNGAVTSGKIAPGAVGSSQLAGGAVQADDLDPSLRSYTSPWLTPASASPISYDGSSLTVRTVAAPEITAAVLASGSIQVFFSFDSTYYVPLPYTSYAGGEPSTVSFQASVGALRITRTSDDNTPPGLAGQVRYVVTPSTAVPGPVTRPARASGGTSVR